MWLPEFGELRPVAGGREYRGRCPACGDPDHMYYNPGKGKRGVWYCHKCGARGRGPAQGVSFLRPRARPGPAGRREAVENPPDPERVHRVYSALLEVLGLSEEHLKHLLGRGFPGELVREKGYRTLPAGARHKVAARVAASCDVSGVPGFYRDSAGWCLAGPPGILIPCRDFEGRIAGLQIRRDAAGKGPKYMWLSSGQKPGGTPARAVLHVAGWKAHPARVWITEGPLKADYCAWKLGEPFLAVPGAGLWRRVGVVPGLVASGADRAVLAYDADWRQKKPVRKALGQLAGILRLAGFDVVFAVWPPEAGKGLDDLLVSGGRPDLKRGETSMVRTIIVGRVNNRPQVKQVKVQGQILDYAKLVLIVHQNGRQEALAVSCWGKLAQQAAQLSPGQLVEVEARLKPSQVQAASGDIVPVVTVNASGIEVWSGGEASAGGNGH